MKKLLGIIVLMVKIKKVALILISAVIVLSCSGTKKIPFTGDKALNGTWVYTDKSLFGNYSSSTEYKFEDGYFEVIRDDLPDRKGTYTTDDGELIINITHYHGDKLKKDLTFEENVPDEIASKWYSEKDLKKLFKTTDEEFEDFRTLFLGDSQVSYDNYTIRDNYLDLKYKNIANRESKTTYTKKQE